METLPGIWLTGPPERVPCPACLTDPPHPEDPCVLCGALGGGGRGFWAQRMSVTGQPTMERVFVADLRTEAP